MKFINPLLFTVITSSLVACGGGGSSSSTDVVETEDLTTTPSYISLSSLTGYFNNTKSTTQTTAEFEAEQAKNLNKISKSKVIVEKKYTSYDADTGLAFFNVEFLYKTNDLFSGPSYSEYSHSNISSGSYTINSSSTDSMVFVNQSADIELHSNDLLYSCNTSTNVFKSTTCMVGAYVDRTKLYDYDFNLVFDVDINTLTSYKDSSTYSSGTYSYRTTRIEEIPILKLNSISIIDKNSDKVFGTLYPN